MKADAGKIVVVVVVRCAEHGRLPVVLVARPFAEVVLLGTVVAERVAVPKMPPTKLRFGEAVAVHSVEFHRVDQVRRGLGDFLSVLNVGTHFLARVTRPNLGKGHDVVVRVRGDGQPR